MFNLLMVSPNGSRHGYKTTGPRMDPSVPRKVRTEPVMSCSLNANPVSEAKKAAALRSNRFRAALSSESTVSDRLSLTFNGTVSASAQKLSGQNMM